MRTESVALFSVFPDDYLDTLWSAFSSSLARWRNEGVRGNRFEYLIGTFQSS